MDLFITRVCTALAFFDDFFTKDTQAKRASCYNVNAEKQIEFICFSRIKRNFSSK